MTADDVREECRKFLEVRVRQQPNGLLSVVTPYLYADHDNVEVKVVRLEGDNVQVHDNGSTLAHLATEKIDMTDAMILFVLARLGVPHGVWLRDGQIGKGGHKHNVASMIDDVAQVCCYASKFLHLLEELWEKRG